MRDQLTFLLNGEPVVVRGVDPTTTVLRWLRETRRLAGTKEGCAEGDCGACTVLAGHLSDGRIVYEAINACIVFLPMLEGLSVVTVEGVAGPGGALHPCQQAMVDCHGSQCGFCTPGFVMTLYGDYMRADKPEEAVGIDETLAGNLCRCTGYAPIRAAATRMYALPQPAWDTRRYGPDIVAALTAIQHDDEVEISGNCRTMRIVATEDQFADYYAAHPEARIVAGATDVGLWVTKQHRELPRLLHLRRSRPASERKEEATWLGAFATHAEWRRSNRLGLAELLRRFAGPQVRSFGTVGGNIANASPIGDLAPALLAQGAILRLRRGEMRREMPLDAFFLAYAQTALRPGEFIEAVRTGDIDEPQMFAVYKVSKRFDDDITAVCGAFGLTIHDGDIVRARVAYGGMAATPRRAIAVENALVGKPLTRATIDDARAAVARDFAPISDMRASASYRLDIAQNLLIRFFIEYTAPETHTRLVGPRAAFGG